jgi:hypothetical protein
MTENKQQYQFDEETLKAKVEELSEKHLGEDFEISTEELKEMAEQMAVPQEVKFRHPQQLLTNKEIQILLMKKAKNDAENKEREEKGEEAIDELSEVEKGAIKLFFLRAKYHNSKPKQLSAKQRTAKKAARKTAKKSRKANRK